MIGELINKFENMEQQTVENFNQLFPHCKLVGFDNASQVTIGELFGDARHITIDNHIPFYHEMKMMFTTAKPIKEKRGTWRRTAVKAYAKDGTFIGEFSTMGQVKWHLNLQDVAFYRKIKLKEIILEKI